MDAAQMLPWFHCIHQLILGPSSIRARSVSHLLSGVPSSLIAFCLQEGVFQGLIPILNCYLENMEVDVDTRCAILNYLKLIKKRASGKRREDHV